MSHAEVAQSARGPAADAAREWLTQDQVADRYQTSKRHVQELDRRKKLPRVQIGRLVRYPSDILDEIFLAEALARIESATPSDVQASADAPVRRRRRVVDPGDAT